MKILYTLNAGNPGGMEIHVLDLVRGMKARGHEVHVCCNEGVIVNWYKNAGAKVFVAKAGFDLDPAYIYSIFKYLKENQIDIVHSHELVASAASLLAGFFAGTKVRISHIHTPISEWIVTDELKKAFTSFMDFCYSIEVNLFASCEIALTESRKQIKMHEGIAENKIYIIPNGIDVYKFAHLPDKLSAKKELVQKYQVDENSFLFGNVSRLTEEKGHNTLIQAFDLFINHASVKGQPVSLLIVGGGTLQTNLEKMISEANLQDKIKITGIFDEEDKLKFYSAFDAFIFPSRAEGFGIVLLEAMAAGLPIIASNLDVLQEVAGSTAMYFSVGDSVDLSQKMLDLYLRRDNLKLLEQEAKKRAEDLYSLTRFEDEYESLYLSLLGKKP
ncbi:MAG TPA: glycosyltransferase family 4 protein [Candidatus Saccharimonadales bacterium]|nr:glycosyltransferase family 4 protein [Candidatus Saccharimonadales bacterium]